ncbi:MAG: hypothetical protein AAF804_11560, partial [Bacteroidota bacterium]
MKNFLFVSLILLSTSHQLLAQSAGNLIYQPDQIATEVIPPPPPGASNLPGINPNLYEFEINGLANVVADSYLATFNVIQVASNALEADEIISARIETMLKALEGSSLT